MKWLNVTSQSVLEKLVRMQIDRTLKNKLRVAGLIIACSILCMLSLALIYAKKNSTLYTKLEFVFDNKYDVNGCYSKLYWGDVGRQYSEEKASYGFIRDNKSIIDISTADGDYYRIDFVDSGKKFGLSKVNVLFFGLRVRSYDSLTFIDYCMDIENSGVEDVNEQRILVNPPNDDPLMYIEPGFARDIRLSLCEFIMNVGFASAILMTVLLIILLFMPTGNDQRNINNVFRVLISFISFVVWLAFLEGVYLRYYLLQNFRNVELGQIIFHINNSLEGTNFGPFVEIVVTIVIIGFLCFGIFFVIDFVKIKKLWKMFIVVLQLGYGIGAIALLILTTSEEFGIADYLSYVADSTDIYDNNYVDPKSVDILFPDKKRNLIYIFLESMESTYADESFGGAMSSNYIPELTSIASDKNWFSTSNDINGAVALSGATFTTGAIVAQTAGIVVNEAIVSNRMLNGTFEYENDFLPGIYSLGDILKENGYNQEFMIGSDAKFGGRYSYFKNHGDYDVFDYYTAIDKGYIPEDYYEWWGYEDQKLFEYAKSEITKLAKKGEPFNCSLLTVDTHFIDGYLCPLCENVYDDQYSNVIACSSKQVDQFVEWIKSQDFYSNTTIIISGDHPTMDTGYIDAQGVNSGYTRKTYFAIINPADRLQNIESVDRAFSSMDIFPTVVASLGASISGDRLGMGTNLFSDVETLVEKYGADYLNVELKKNSAYYSEKLTHKSK
ncbi:LTA synthase family protein [Butyrivibrio sp. WCE2006]|uniref:LTA synthase family protein n=1 Tax=Butyrivibrio sp. WCE2006 TaxID=1410611 RepID=UPI0012DE9C2F